MPRDPVRDRARLGGAAGPAEPWAPAWLRVDLGLFIGAAGLSVVGVVLVWSSTRAESGAAMALKQAVAVVVGMAAAALITRLDVRLIRAVAPLVYVAALLGLVAVLSPLGRQVNGSRSWIGLPGGFTIQPSELMKVALAIGLAMLLADRADRGERQRHRDIALAWVLAGLPIALVLAQPDLGSALVLVAMSAAVIASAGGPAVWTVGVAAVGAATVVAAFTSPLLSPYQRDRLRAFLDPSLDPQGIGYQTTQVRAAVASGGWDGQGLFAGRQTQAGLIPYQESDFIFSVAGEELGFLGASGVVILLGFVVLRALVVARRADAFGRLLSTGIGVWLGVQAIENVGMNLGLLPVTGLPLPFLSYGGTSMIAAWVAIGLVGNVAAESANRRLAGRR
ncbi:MAG TPA: FtsW/RodA/SpoVE family cell cycle protein [Intrasporangium sp.]|uniref:FtsW/RodA/SpoVE family cell cycle protein n=1 Tax=Intrasporangium sp. TaxID=1925024 RepID=UPI002B473295|nr:FtsW/RodA/SpoVE family cell cycle protein [Intrasporangium sp.]HKX66848.1 FtsW/RodA/SpoVE family cell cycle protein [Intrasporangium sp.]